VLAAASLGLSEREFVRQAATKLAIEFQERAIAVDLSVFGSKARRIFESLQRVGALPILEGQCAKGFVAVDPAEVHGVELFDGTQPVSIATWSEISRALDASEQLLVEADSAARSEVAKHEEQLCQRIFGVLLEEAHAHGATALDVIASDENATYQFTSEWGHIGTGSINKAAVSGLMSYLCSRPGNIMHSTLVGPVVIRMLATSNRLQLSWGMQRQVKKPIATPLKTPVVSSKPHTEAFEVEASQHPDVSPNLVAESRVPAQEEPAIPHELEGWRPAVLVVDDNLMFGRVLEKLLRREGFDPLFATNGAEAYELLSRAQSLTPQIVVCDLHMPVMNGRDFLARMKADMRFRSIPVIMLTSDDDVEAEIGLLEAGAEAFISKSKDPRILCAQIRKFARKLEVREAA
jgi:CheY-like chemotaxis protein